MEIAIFGSTGSVGKSALEIVRLHRERFQVRALAAHSNIELLEKQIKEFHPQIVVVYDEHKRIELQKKVPHVPILTGSEGLLEMATDPKVEFVLLAMSGTKCLQPAIAAIEAKKRIGIANKELLVCAGKLITDLAKKRGVTLLPVDSEHSAIFQCLHKENNKKIRRLILTASGGPFRKYTTKQLQNVTVEKALNHPSWKMGPKITIDSSTLMNKGLEVIEAHYLFDIPVEQIEMVIHPQSIIHSMVEFCDGSILAQLSKPSMTLPIQYAFSYPDRIDNPSSLDMQTAFQLEFEPIDRKKFVCLNLAVEALKKGKSYPCFLNAANEVLVERFLNRQIQWFEIGEKLKKLISSHPPENMVNLQAILAVEKKAKEAAQQI